MSSAASRMPARARSRIAPDRLWIPAGGDDGVELFQQRIVQRDRHSLHRRFTSPPPLRRAPGLEPDSSTVRAISSAPLVHDQRALLLGFQRAHDIRLMIEIDHERDEILELWL